MRGAGGVGKRNKTIAVAAVEKMSWGGGELTSEAVRTAQGNKNKALKSSSGCWAGKTRND